ncbi:MAG: metallophosphoesterase family protein [Coriobacteriales bacterium]|nr:metallophosphoesterase family protein [Coriobacteriales bacterium]
MRVLTISDTHGELSIESYEALSNLEFDACVSLGDVDQETLGYWESRCQAIGVPMYAMVGNHDTWQWLDGFEYLVDVHNRCFDLGPYRCFGFGCSYDYAGLSAEDKQTIPVLTDEESLVLEDAPPVDVLFTHDSAKIDRVVNPAFLATAIALIPHAANHPGLLGITNYIEKNAPKYAISGHHHMTLTLRYKDTICIGTYGLTLIDLDTGRVESLLHSAKASSSDLLL